VILNRIIPLVLLALPFNSSAQTIRFEGREFEISNAKASVVDFNGEKVLKMERDLKQLPFDADRLEETVDEPFFAKLKGLDFQDGVIEVKMLSQIQEPSPFQFAQGFIGLAFRIADDNSAYESIYLRPKVGRSDNQSHRNKAVQYYAYPDYKFEKLRKQASGMYETTAPVGLNEWITMRIEVKAGKAHMFINDTQYSTFVVDKMLGNTTRGAVALWVDIGTIGYFKDLKIIQQPN